MQPNRKSDDTDDRKLRKLKKQLREQTAEDSAYVRTCLSASKSVTQMIEGASCEKELTEAATYAQSRPGTEHALRCKWANLIQQRMKFLDLL